MGKWFSPHVNVMSFSGVMIYFWIFIFSIQTERMTETVGNVIQNLIIACNRPIKMIITNHGPAMSW